MTDLKEISPLIACIASILWTTPSHLGRCRGDWTWTWER